VADLSVIDRFTETFSRYIDSGFGLLSGDVTFLSSTLIGIDVTLAGLAWSLKADDHIMVTLAKKVLYVGAFAFIIGSFKSLADIVFASFSSIGLKAAGGALTAADLTRPGFVAAAGFTAAHPLLDETGQFSGFDVLTNLPTILILLFCWILIVLAFFVLSVQPIRRVPSWGRNRPWQLTPFSAHLCDMARLLNQLPPTRSQPRSGTSG
jgi:type IV secretion system protein TrbL